jgi:hypothetical protein
MAVLGAAALGCGSGGGGQPTTASPACYPACIASLLQECPLQGTCEGSVAAESATVCYANGIKVNDQLISGPETVTVNNAKGQPCYTVTQTSAIGQASRSFDVTVNGQVVASITDNQASDNSAILYCGTAGTRIAFPAPGADCQPLWWADEQRCTYGTCSFP